MCSKQSRSSSSVVTPGFTCSPIMSRTSAARRPATRIFSCSAGDLMEMCRLTRESMECTFVRRCFDGEEMVYSAAFFGNETHLNHTRNLSSCLSNDKGLSGQRHNEWMGVLRIFAGYP